MKYNFRIKSSCFTYTSTSCNTNRDQWAGSKFEFDIFMKHATDCLRLKI